MTRSARCARAATHRWGCMRSAVLLLGVTGAMGCAVTPSSPNGTPSSSAADSRHFQIYDNEKDWGPNHLAGPPDAPAVPGRHIEDQRTVPPDPEGERPSGSGAQDAGPVPVPP